MRQVASFFVICAALLVAIILLLRWIDPSFPKSMTIEAFGTLLGGVGSSFALLFLATTTMYQRNQMREQANEMKRNFAELQKQAVALSISADAQLSQTKELMKQTEESMKQTSELVRQTVAQTEQARLLKDSSLAQVEQSKAHIAQTEALRTSVEIQIKQLASAYELSKTDAVYRRVQNFVRHIIQRAASAQLHYGTGGSASTLMLLGNVRALAESYSIAPGLVAQYALDSLGASLETISSIKEPSWNKSEIELALTEMEELRDSAKNLISFLGKANNKREPEHYVEEAAVYFASLRLRDFSYKLDEAVSRLKDVLNKV